MSSSSYARPGQRIYHALQTNGTLLDDDWCAFLNKHKFLIGLSVDGPPRFHDHYRVTNSGQASSGLVFKGLKLLQRHKVEFNLLTVLNDVNVHHPDEMIEYLLSLGTRWLQFIPAIEWVKDPNDPSRNILASYSPDPVAYGKFLCRTFDVWFEKLRHRVSVRDFDAVLNRLVLGQSPLCILDGSCHHQLTIEHDGAIFGCDHFIERRWQLAQIGDPDWTNALALDGRQGVGLTVHGSGYAKNSELGGRDIQRTDDVPVEAELAGVGAGANDSALLASSNLQPHSSPAKNPARAADSVWLDRVDGTRLGAFAQRKQNLPDQCLACKWKAFCYGGCPKHRSTGGEKPEPTILCAGYMMFFEHAMPRLDWLANFLRHNQRIPEPEGVSPRRKQDKQPTVR